VTDKNHGALGPAPDVSPTLEELLEKARSLPPMTEEQRIEQRISFAWGNAAIEWPDPPLISLDKFAADQWRKEWRAAQKRIEELEKVIAAHIEKAFSR